MGAQFRDAGIDSAALDAKLLILAVTGWSETDLILRADEALMPADIDALDGCASRRLSGEPIDHILGYRDFYGRRFHVTKDVLSPRQETEALVELVLNLSGNLKDPSFLDLGTGSGAIAISLLAERADATGLAVDVSDAALGIAKDNASRHNVGERLRLACGSWFEPVTGQFDIIVSNPPYIKELEGREGVHDQADSFEPHLALYLPDDEYDKWYEVFFSHALNSLKDEGALMIEGHEDCLLHLKEIALKYFAKVVLKTTTGNNKEEIISIIQNIKGEGMTAGATGMKLAYRHARNNFVTFAF